MLFKIYCENIVVVFLNCNFLFFILFLSFIHTIFFFTTRVYPLLSPSSPFFLYFFFFFLLFFYLILEPLSLSLSFFLQLSFFFFLFYQFIIFYLFLLDSRTLSTVIRDREIKNKRLLAPPLIEGHRQALSLFCSIVGQMAFVSLFFFFFSFFFIVMI